MKWILVWWIINPGQPQAVHIERGFSTEAACDIAGGRVPAHNAAVRWHCSQE
jgi:hypothetical protein